ncbi:MAG: hypothetical protein D6763_02000 [Alphaproteobacteria bacterium]|nr:MAG: hypothetical protein D6763_02000 [Alphaproteobacteria bacterium]
MEQENDTGDLIPRCGLAETSILVTNPDPIPGLTEAFADNRRFCMLPIGDEQEFDQLYNNTQDSLNQLSADICLSLAVFLANSTPTDDLWSTLAPCLTTPPVARSWISPCRVYTASITASSWMTDRSDRVAAGQIVGGLHFPQA